MRVVLVLDCHDPNAQAAFWAAALGYQPSPSSPPYVVLVPPEPGPPELVLQQVPEPKTVKNRMHLDIRIADIEAEAARLQRLGAKPISEQPIQEDGFRWIVMADPEGNEFCVCAEPVS
ncbi:MAG: VOC family protein [Actinomycetota bacterium]|nr:VOC family protein [Actinomycetota bacterium]